MVKRFRADKKRSMCSGISKDRIQQLESIGFRWRASEYLSSQNDIWEAMYEKLKQYKAEYGDTDVPQKYADNPQLGSWVNKQRSGYKNFRAGKKQSMCNGMSEDRIQQLESIGFGWVCEKKISPTWKVMYENLKQYKSEYGDTNVPLKYAGNPQLGKWVSTQRSWYKHFRAGKTGLTCNYRIYKDRIQKLESMGFQWVRVRATKNK